MKKILYSLLIILCFNFLVPVEADAARGKKAKGLTKYQIAKKLHGNLRIIEAGEPDFYIAIVPGRNGKLHAKKMSSRLQSYEKKIGRIAFVHDFEDYTVKFTELEWADLTIDFSGWESIDFSIKPKRKGPFKIPPQKPPYRR